MNRFYGNLISVEVFVVYIGIRDFLDLFIEFWRVGFYFFIMVESDIGVYMIDFRYIFVYW